MKTSRPPGRAAAPRQQYGALPFRAIDNLEILLITSRETQRWILPKGWPIKSYGPSGTAAREALEEAGITGDVGKAPIGAYTYTKRGFGGQSWLCEVAVFPLRVRKLRDDWPEREQRSRQWFTYLEAADAVAEIELRSLILGFGIAFDEMRR